MSEHTQTPEPSPPPVGQMTAVMRAAEGVQREGLRLALLRANRVAEERVFREPRAISVGSDPASTFVLSGRDVPKSFRLFTHDGKHYRLRFTAAMQGKIATDRGVQALDEARRKARYDAGVYELTLTPGSRGRVEIAGTSLLFQLIETPPPGARPALPPSVMRGAVGIDWNTTVIAAFSFLLHLMAISAVYSDFGDPVVDTEVNVAALVEMVKNLPPPPELEQKNAEAEQENKAEQERAPEVKQPTRKAAPGEKRRLSTAQVAALSQQLDSLDMGILGANIGKSATSDVLSSIDSIDTSLMDRAAASGAGVSSGGPGGLQLGAAGGAIRPGETGGTLADLGETKKSTPESSGTVKQVEGPKGQANMGGANVAGGTVSNASRVVAGMRAGFRACYTRGLAADPGASGRIDLRLRIGPGGEVVEVSAQTQGNVPASVVACVKARAKSGRFAPPEGGAAVITVPVTLVPQ